jgi:hypothetical protein
LVILIESLYSLGVRAAHAAAVSDSSAAVNAHRTQGACTVAGTAVRAAALHMRRCVCYKLQCDHMTFELLMQQQTHELKARDNSTLHVMQLLLQRSVGTQQLSSKQQSDSNLCAQHCSTSLTRHVAKWSYMRNLTLSFSYAAALACASGDKPLLLLLLLLLLLVFKLSLDALAALSSSARRASRAIGVQ